MLVKTYSAFVSGVDAQTIMIETDVSTGLPSYQIVGQADNSIKESKERIRLSILNSGYTYPKGKITINMVPAELKKRGSHFDLAIAVGLLSATNQINIDKLTKFCFLGELSLDGTIKSVKGILPMVLAMKKAGFHSVILPKANLKEASLVSGINTYGAEYLEEVVHFFSGSVKLEMGTFQIDDPQDNFAYDQSKDFADVEGQEAAKRAIMIAAAGNHGLLMIGSPSTGKTMLSERIPGIMPEMNFSEILEVTTVYSISGLLDEQLPYMRNRPFRQPHHKVTTAALLGGGSIPKPGEITLANKGVLFLDEIGEFDYRILDALRIPLEKKKITLIRQNQTFTYPADFLLVGASNPCPCGYLGDPIHACKCSASEISRYQRRFSGPVLDRIDMQIYLMPVAYHDLNSSSVLSSAEMKQKIEAARLMQKERYAGSAIMLNQQLDESNIHIYGALAQDAEDLLALSYEKMNLNPRTLLKVRKLARTIADLEGCEEIKIEHLTEALQYRVRKNG